MSSIEQRYKEIQSRITGVSPAGAQVKLLAVSKAQPIEKIIALYQLGHRDFGENYVQELLQKAQTLDQQGLKDIRWHFIGHLQRNKVKMVLPWVYEIQSVDRFELAEEISKRYQQFGREKRLRIFIQVNIDAEESKSGLTVEQTVEIVRKISQLPGLDLRGLMTIPNPDLPHPEEAFVRLRELEKQCHPHTHGELSMGMSHDFEAAIQSGSTVVRVGTALFGERQ